MYPRYLSFELFIMSFLFVICLAIPNKFTDMAAIRLKSNTLLFRPLGNAKSYFCLFEMKGRESCDRNPATKAENNCQMSFAHDRFLCIEHAFHAFAWHLAFSCIFLFFFSWHFPPVMQLRGNASSLKQLKL